MKTDLHLFDGRQSIQVIKMSNQQIAIAIKDLNVCNISFVVGQTKAGRNPPINLKYGNRNLLIGLPKMRFPAGVLMRESEKGDTSYTMMGSLEGCDPYAKTRYDGPEAVGLFYNFLLDLDARIIQEATENSVKWFGKKRSEEVVRDCFKSNLNPSATKIDGEYVPNGKYPPSYRAKLPVFDNNVTCPIEDNLKNPVYVKPESLQVVFPKNIEAGLVLSGQIYVLAGGGFGVTWKVQGAQVFPQAREKVTDFFQVVPTAAEEEVVEETPSEVPETPSNSQAESAAQQPPGAPGRKRRVAPAS